MLDRILAAHAVEPRAIYPVPVVADILSVRDQYVRQLIRQGKIRALRRGRGIIGVTHADLAEFLGN